MIVTLTTGQKIEVDIQHQKINRPNRKNPDLIEEHRCTIAKLFWFDNNTSRRVPGVISVGEAHCHPDDKFVKKNGVKIALRAALCRMGAFTKEDRRKVWEKIWNNKYQN